MNPPVIMEHDGILVVRDDLLPGDEQSRVDFERMVEDGR